MTRKPRLWLAVILALLLGTVCARATPTRAVVRDLPGDDAPSVRNALVRMLAGQSGIQLVSRAHFEKLAKHLGAKDPGIKKALHRALGLSVVIEGEVEQSDAGVSVTVRVLGTDGEVLESQELSAKTQHELVKKIDREGWKLLGPTIEEATPPKESKPRLVVLALSGAKAAQVRAALAKALGKSADFEVVSDTEAEAAQAGDAKQPKARALVAAALGASVLVSGDVQGTRALKLTLVVHNGKNGDDLGEVKFEGATLALLDRAIAGDLLKKLAPLAAGAERPTPPGEEPVDDAPDDAPPPTRAASRPAPLEAALTLGAGTRNYRYSDDLFAALRAYKMGPTPTAALAARWYPVAHFTGGFAANLGLAVAYERAFLIQSEANGETYDTRAQQWLVGVHARLPVGALELGVDLGLGAHAFEVDDDAKQPLVPSVDYRFLRAGLDARYRSGSFLVGAAFGYRHVTDAGEVASDAWFPRADVAGLDLGAHAGYAVIPRVYLLAGALYRRYWFSMNPEPGDPFVAGGALDSYVTGWAGIGWELAGD